jgi:hypothetical protein
MKKSMLILLSVFIIAAWLLGSVAQVMAETWKYKTFNHLTKIEGLAIPDAEGHWGGLQIREGVTIYENGEMSWHKVLVIYDGVKGVGSFDQYITATFQDGSTITNYAKQAKSFVGGFKWTADIIHGTGRFQGIKGTVTAAGKFLPLEKGEIVGKAVGEGTLSFTLPPK